ncbi:MAG TPA: GNAT family N-acetyltransferase [Microlunatus sp.]
MIPTLTGTRLRLVPADASHLELFYELNSSAAVMKHITGAISSRIEVESEWSRRLGPRTDVARGLGYWAGFLGDGRFVGWWGLGVPSDEQDAGELGFRIKPEFWRQGFGSDGARCVINHGFTATSISRIWAGTVSENTGSRATLAKLGLRCIDEPASARLTYQITRQEWAASGAGDPSST